MPLPSPLLLPCAACTCAARLSAVLVLLAPACLGLQWAIVHYERLEDAIAAKRDLDKQVPLLVHPQLPRLPAAHGRGGRAPGRAAQPGGQCRQAPAAVQEPCLPLHVGLCPRWARQWRQSMLALLHCAALIRWLLLLLLPMRRSCQASARDSKSCLTSRRGMAARGGEVTARVGPRGGVAAATAGAVCCDLSWRLPDIDIPAV